MIRYSRVHNVNFKSLAFAGLFCYQYIEECLATMKNKSPIIGVVSVVFFIAGCSKVYTITDNAMLYPANASAQSWGMINFYSQYQNSELPSAIRIALPNGQAMNGQMTFVENSGTTDADDDFWDNVRVGIGVGHRVGRHGSWGFGVSSPSRSTYHSDKQTVSVNAFGEQVGMNCQGDFNRRQKAGTLHCKLTNGMEYNGTLRRIITQ